MSADIVPVNFRSDAAMNEGQRQIFSFGRFVLAFAQVEAYLRVTLTERKDSVNRVLPGFV